MALHPFLRNFDVILLDMNSTFMFDEDRFGPDQDYAATYRSLNGSRLSGDQVHEIITACCDYMIRIGRDPARFNDFPSVKEALQTVSGSMSIDTAERDRLAKVIAAHEIGKVPKAHANALHKLADHHRLGLVTYIWSEKDLWLEVFKACGIDDLFEAITWSADGNAIKPAPALFERAILEFEVPRSRMVFVGDNPMRDIEGADAVGLATIWVNDGRRAPPNVEPGLVVSSLTDLVIE